MHSNPKNTQGLREMGREYTLPIVLVLLCASSTLAMDSIPDLASDDEEHTEGIRSLLRDERTILCWLHNQNSRECSGEPERAHTHTQPENAPVPRLSEDQTPPDTQHDTRQPSTGLGRLIDRLASIKINLTGIHAPPHESEDAPGAAR